MARTVMTYQTGFAGIARLSREDPALAVSGGEVVTSLAVQLRADHGRFLPHRPEDRRRLKRWYGGKRLLRIGADCFRRREVGLNPR